ncbi:hypothetical protein [Leptospira licerasiae]|uniref:Uncharacterized protein n=1 Tax=Leptospira licerasiae str. MMD4847 TaxID=1049971 RepID=A0ABN0HB68_9LEPT|nr:hypothetical protein [Leptospira licerasiae]EIE00470.1 hypothetical protein LEP1GSC185_3222 [Leptospira licerasiae serovar Varillal str. VAR 010]EJZ42920.1 hypothetical protein LEP1GSC178_2839 [Leptospira licerasiae str. MMD4847]TGM86593.1 hypothetical protein EHR05_16740 [Leptospira licerasiae]
MKIKVAHLLRKTEEIDRDLTELGKIKDRIAADRDYSESLKVSIGSEMDKLSAQKQEMLSMKTKETPSDWNSSGNPSGARAAEGLYQDNEKRLTREISVEIQGKKQQPARKTIHKY